MSSSTAAMRRGPVAPDDDPLAGVEPEAARRLLLAAIDSFADLGYHGTSTRRIAANAGMSPAALYIHYPSKAALLFQIVRAGHEGALRALERSLEGASDPPTRLWRLVHGLTAWHARHHRLLRVGHAEFEALGDEDLQTVVELRRAIEQAVRAELQLGIDRGDFSVPDVGGVAVVLIGLAIDVTRWYSLSGRRAPEEIGELYADLALRMVRPDAAGAGAAAGAA